MLKQRAIEMSKWRIANGLRYCDNTCAMETMRKTEVIEDMKDQDSRN